MAKIKTHILELTAFTSGAVVMMLELTGSRILSPYLGTSTFIWTSLIGIILGSLSLGYWLGGRLADQKLSFKTLSSILALAGLLIAATALFQKPILEAIEIALSDLRTASILATIILFTPASIFLGMVSPYCIRLKLSSLKTSGQTVGNLYAISTIGSIFGTFLTGFFLLAYLGSIQILFLLAAILALTALLLSKSIPKLVLIIAILALAFNNQAKAEDVIDIDTEYNRVQIYEDSEIRYLEVGRNESSAMHIYKNELVYDYTKFYDLAEEFAPDFKSALMIGGGAYSYPKHFLTKYPEAKLDVVEIDPKLTEISEQYFNLKKDPNLEIYHQDGRTFLNKNKRKYDVIFGDAFKSLYSIPYQLTTLEATQRLANSLSKNGVAIVNIGGSINGDSGKFFRAQYRTFKEVFPQVEVFLVQKLDPTVIQNIILVAHKSEQKIPQNSDNQMLKQIWNEEIPLDMPILTDNFAPVDQYMMSFFDQIKL